MANTGGSTAWLPKTSRRPRRVYFPASRSGGLRRLPDDRFGLSAVCSLIAHAMMIGLLIFGAADLSGSGGVVNSPIITWVDLTAHEPDGGIGHASTPATRAMRRSGPSALPSPSRSASTAPAAFSPPAAENSPLGSLRAGSAPEVLVFG